MVTTDHDGFDHAKLNLEAAYPELVQSRQLVPDLLQFYGLELNMPGMEHHTVIVPAGPNEAATVFDIESRFDANQRWPREPARNTEAARVAALRYRKVLRDTRQRLWTGLEHPREKTLADPTADGVRRRQAVSIRW